MDKVSELYSEALESASCARIYLTPSFSNRFLSLYMQLNTL